MDASSWEDKLRERYCDKTFYFLPYEGEEEEADSYEWEYVATDEYLCGYFTMRIYYDPETRLVTDFECERFNEESDVRPLMEEGNVTRIQQKEFTAFFKSQTTQSERKIKKLMASVVTTSNAKNDITPMCIRLPRAKMP